VPKATVGLEVPVNPGEHAIVVRAPNMAETRRTVTVKEGEHAILDIELVL